MILSRLVNSRYSEVLPVWIDHSVVIIGGGPSLTSAQVDQVAVAIICGGVKCITVNDAYLLAPWADVHYAADQRWHRWHTEGVERDGLSAPVVSQRWADLTSQKCSIENGMNTVDDETVHILKNADGNSHGYGLSLDRQSLVTGRNSGFQALNLAVLSGTKRIILLGFDGQPGPDGRSHWFGDHPQPQPASTYMYFRAAMAAAAPILEAMDVQVLNASPGTAIDAFVKVNLWDVL